MEDSSSESENEGHEGMGGDLVDSKVRRWGQLRIPGVTEGK